MFLALKLGKRNGYIDEFDDVNLCLSCDGTSFSLSNQQLEEEEKSRTFHGKAYAVCHFS